MDRDLEARLISLENSVKLLQKAVFNKTYSSSTQSNEYLKTTEEFTEACKKLAGQMDLIDETKSRVLQDFSSKKHISTKQWKFFLAMYKQCNGDFPNFRLHNGEQKEQDAPPSQDKFSEIPF